MQEIVSEQAKSRSFVFRRRPELLHPASVHTFLEKFGPPIRLQEVFLASKSDTPELGWSHPPRRYRDAAAVSKDIRAIDIRGTEFHGGFLLPL